MKFFYGRSKLAAAMESLLVTLLITAVAISIAATIWLLVNFIGAGAIAGLIIFGLVWIIVHCELRET